MDSLRVARWVGGVAPLFPLVLLAACTRYEGPLEVYQKNRRGDRADLPGYTIDEQKARARERNPLIDDDRELYPVTQADRPGGVGR